MYLPSKKKLATCASTCAPNSQRLLRRIPQTAARSGRFVSAYLRQLLHQAFGSHARRHRDGGLRNPASGNRSRAEGGGLKIKGAEWRGGEKGELQGPRACTRIQDRCRERGRP